MALKLYNYARNSAGYRVRIALNLKGLTYEHCSVDIRPGSDAQHEKSFRALNPQELVPVLVDGKTVIPQSSAIIEYLEERFPRPRLLPRRSGERARVRAFALTVACDIHPLNNMRVISYLQKWMGQDEEARRSWYRHWVALGFEALETELRTVRRKGPYAFGRQPTLADVFLVPQWDVARRWGCDLTPYPRLADVVDTCLRNPAFAKAAPERQPDFER